MNVTTQLAKHFREVHFGGNWTSVNLRDTLNNVHWQLATAKLNDIHTIAELVYHIHYYVSAQLKVLEGGPLSAHDKFSFDLPPIQSEEDWQTLLNTIWTDAERFAARVENFSGQELEAHFSEKKYGSYYRNFQGIIEHTHYHLGQIVLIKKILLHSEKKK